MNHSQEQLTHALETYAASLDQLTPSQGLHTRMQAAIQNELAARPARSQARRSIWAIAASLLVAAAAWTWLRVLPDSASLASRPDHGATVARTLTTEPSTATSRAMVFPTGVVSLWPTQGTVFRVRSTLNSIGPQQYAQQYWIDVRMANDGSMRIERILAADGTELYARPRIEP